VAEAENLQRAAPHELHAALRSDDPVTKQAAAYTVARRTARMTDGQKLLLARELIPMLSNSDALSRALAQQALAVLADRNRPLRITAAQWTTFWDNLERERLIGPRANAYLIMAQRLEERGQLQDAIDRYQRILSEFPNTRAAEDARQRLSQLAAK
jgi:hypothetical protein